MERHIRDHGQASRLPSSRQYSELIEILVNHNNRSPMFFVAADSGEF
jgi:hypothetical protein